MSVKFDIPFSGGCNQYSCLSVHIAAAWLSILGYVVACTHLRLYNEKTTTNKTNEEELFFLPNSNDGHRTQSIISNFAVLKRIMGHIGYAKRQ